MGADWVWAFKEGNEIAMSCRLHPHYRIENSDCGVSYIYQHGVNSRIIVVLACPGENERTLGFPAAGETGARLCRIFEKMRELGDGKYEDVCLRNVRIVNASVNVYDSSSKIKKSDITSNTYLKFAFDKEPGSPRRLILLLVNTQFGLINPVRVNVGLRVIL